MVLGSWLPPLLALAFLAIYIRTAAPGLLSGDPAELQLVAVTLGVAHPTTYPLYTMLGHLAVRLIPLGEPAWRVTLVSALCAALAVGGLALLIERLGASRRAALLGSLALGFAPGLWNAATLAEVYALLALLIVALAVAVCPHPPSPAPGLGAGQLHHSRGAGGEGAAFLAGLGFTHHGLFALVALPPFAVWAALGLRRLPVGQVLRRIGALALGFVAGCTPWLYPLIQYARLGPFSGEDYGLPRHYYWGAPESWGAAIDLLTGGTVRRGIFRLPTPDQALATLDMLQGRAWFELGPLGLALASIGGVVMLRRAPRPWLAALWVLLATSGYLLLLGPAVADAPIFTLPMLIPLALWVGYGADAVLSAPIASWLRLPRATPTTQPIGHWGLAIGYRLLGWLPCVLLLAGALAWADTRVEHSSKRSLTLYRTFGEAVLRDLPPDAVVIAHWEQGMTLQYLRLAEQQRPDVWVDVVEPGDEPWAERVARRYQGREVFLVGQAPDVAGLPVDLVREDDYALLFQLRR